MFAFGGKSKKTEESLSMAELSLYSTLLKFPACLKIIRKSFRKYFKTLRGWGRHLARQLWCHFGCPHPTSDAQAAQPAPFPSPASCSCRLWEVKGNGLSTWVFANYVEHLHEFLVPGFSQAQPKLWALRAGNQWVEAFPLSLSAFQINKK